MRRIRVVWLLLTIGCGDDAAATETSAETTSGAESTAQDEPMAVIEHLIAATEAGDQEAMLATLHPALREAASAQIAETDRHPQLIQCLRETVANGTVEPLTDEPRTAEYGEDPRQIVVPGRSDQAAVIRHEGHWYILDTGC